jgi:hypothetical protein
MSNEHLFFISLNFFLVICYLSRKNGFDFFGISYFSSVIYFSPGFFGYTGLVATKYDWMYWPLNEKVYIIYIIYLLALLFFTVLYDLFVKGNLIQKKSTEIDDYEFRTEMKVAISFIFMSFLLLNVFGGAALHNLDKDQVMASIGRWYVLYEATILISVAYLCTIVKIRFVYIVPIVFFILFDLYLGFRTTFVISVLMVFFVIFNKNNQRLLSAWPYLLLCLFVVFIVLILKVMMYGLKKGDIEIIIGILENSQTYEKLLSTSEPFVTQSILNSVVDHEYKTDGGHLRLILAQFIFFGDILFDELKNFNSYFQPALFSKVRYGMASNFLAEFYAASGMVGVVAISFIYTGLLFFLNVYLSICRTSYKPVFLLVGVYWSFYIYRNDFSYMLNIEKRVLVGFVLILIVSTIVKKLFVLNTTEIKV